MGGSLAAQNPNKTGGIYVWLTIISARGSPNLDFFNYNCWFVFMNSTLKGFMG